MTEIDPLAYAAIVVAIILASIGLFNYLRRR
jgi:hypothetical protein